MSTGLNQKCIRFERDHLVELERLCLQQNRSLSDLVRSAVASFLNEQKTIADSNLRHLRVTEYMQICLDWMIQQDHPEVRDKIIAQTDQRMRQYHGAR
ncbi:MAG: hypothetical protein EOO77_11170 [Oxalobacteraceae bacterium]|nr:MAG: hypothetical protein EOO77_11170 [Oxalobacteraceae bacterium]